MLSLKLLSSNKRNFVFGDNCEDLKSLFKSLYFHRELAPELLRHGAMEASGVVILDIVFDILTGYFERSNVVFLLQSGSYTRANAK